MKKLVIGLLLQLAAGGAFAVGLGNIHVSSTLNQPFAAQIPVIGASQDELINMTVSLAEPDTFARAGLDRSHVLTRLKFAIVEDGSGGAHIAITSKELVKEPALEFIIDVDWGKGQLRRTFAVLLEPPR